MPPVSAFIRRVIPVLGSAMVIALAIVLVAPPHAPFIMVASSALGGAVVISIGGWLLRRRSWLLPVRRLGSAAQRMARGEWNVRVNPHGAPEIHGLATNLNSLAAQAQTQLADLQQQRFGLRTLVDTLPDPILAADAQGRVTLLNAPAAQLLSLAPSQALGQPLVSVVNDERIVQLYEAIAQQPPNAAAPLHREIRLARNGQRQTYQAMATRAAGGGALLVLRDVSTLAGAVQMKTDFVANASHELRTPIAAIKIAFETLRDVYREDPTQSERCIAVIDGHLRRLEEMLRDLLDLSRVESADLKPHVSLTKTSEVLSLLRATLGSMARQKNIDLQLGDQDSATPVEIRTDSKLLNLVLKNLVENSLKFTPPGGKVMVSIRSLPAVNGKAPGITTVVADTGIGIAPEHIDRVFERFYQVDSARSGSAGRGTGLGLAIVKHAVNALDGTVRVESVVGSGTTVTCEFPQEPVGDDRAE